MRKFGVSIVKKVKNYLQTISLLRGLYIDYAKNYHNLTI